MRPGAPRHKPADTCGGRPRRARSERGGAGQASVELVVGAGFLAVLLTLGLQVVATAGAQWQAQSAAYAGARAEAVGEDGERRALGVLAPRGRSARVGHRLPRGTTVRAREGRVGIDLPLAGPRIAGRVRAAAGLAPAP